jgi:glycosyltransferase involved in cell wall biosynthesis
VRALVVSNMLPDGAAPERGRFVRDQVAALQRLEGLDVELYEFPPGPRELGRAFSRLRRRFGSSSASTAAAIGGPPFDVVHAHFGLSAWAARAVPARVRALTLHGTDVNHPRTRLLTLAALPFIDVLGTASASLAEELPPRWARRRAQPLPCGVDVERFHPIDRERARAELGLRPEGRYVLFPADPARPEKRHDRALALAAACDAELLVLGGVDPEQVPRWVNAANAVVVPSEREGFGLAALEALACDVPVLATPVGVHAEALAGVDGALCAAFDLAGWSAALSPHLHARDPRVQGRARALLFSSTEMAARVAAAWSEALERSV